MDEAAYATVLDSIYDAALNAELWPRALELVSDVFSGGPAALLFQEQTTMGGTGATARLDPSALVDFYRYYGLRNPMTARNSLAMLGNRLPITLDTQVIARRDFMRTEYYNDFYQPNGMHSALMITAAITGTNVATINIMRSETGRDFDEADVRLAQQLQPHLARAVQVGLRLAEAAQGATTTSEVMERSRHGLFAIGYDGTVLQVNRAGLAMLGDGLAIVQSELTAASADTSRRLRRLITETADRWSEQRGGALGVPRPSLRRPYSVIVSPLGEATALFQTGPSALVSVTDPEAMVAPDAGVLRDLFGLSPAEVRICERLVAGDSPQDVAEALSLGISTVRWHLAAIFRKTGTGRQAELVRLLLSLPGA